MYTKALLLTFASLALAQDGLPTSTPTALDGAASALSSFTMAASMPSLDSMGVVTGSSLTSLASAADTAIPSQPSGANTDLVMPSYTTLPGGQGGYNSTGSAALVSGTSAPFGNSTATSSGAMKTTGSSKTTGTAKSSGTKTGAGAASTTTGAAVRIGNSMGGMLGLAGVVAALL